MVDESRRLFLKKSASLAGVAVAAPLLPTEQVPVIRGIAAKPIPAVDFSTEMNLDYDDKKMMRKMERTVKFIPSNTGTVIHISHPTPLRHIYQWEQWLRRHKEKLRCYHPSFVGLYPNFFELNNNSKFANKESFYNLRMSGLKIGDDYWYSIDRVNTMAGRMWANGREINKGSMLQWDKKYIFESEHQGKREKVDLLRGSNITMFTPIVVTVY